jgi:hypothetical protein
MKPHGRAARMKSRSVSLRAGPETPQMKARHPVEAFDGLRATIGPGNDMRVAMVRS